MPEGTLKVMVAGPGTFGSIASRAITLSFFLCAESREKFISSTRKNMRCKMQVKHIEEGKRIISYVHTHFIHSHHVSNEMNIVGII